MVRVVLDTNVLINADRGEFSYPKRILNLINAGKITAIVSHAVKRENELIINKLISDNKLRESLQDYLSLIEEVKPISVVVKLEDREDKKLLEAAIGGEAQFLITDDRHLLELGEYQGIKIFTSEQFWQWWTAQQDKDGTNWNSWAKSILGK